MCLTSHEQECAILFLVATNWKHPNGLYKLESTHTKLLPRGTKEWRAATVEAWWLVVQRNGPLQGTRARFLARERRFPSCYVVRPKINSYQANRQKPPPNPTKHGASRERKVPWKSKRQRLHIVREPFYIIFKMHSYTIFRTLCGSQSIFYFLYMNVHSSIISNSQKVATFKCPSTDEQIKGYPHNRIWFTHKKEWSTDTCNNMDEYWKHHAKGKKTVTEDYTPYGSIPMKVQNRETHRLRWY